MRFIRAVAFFSAQTLLAACSPPEAAPTLDVAAIHTQALETASAAIPTTTPIQLPPTPTSIPTAAETAEPEPIELTGAGDSVVEMQKWPGPALLHAKYTGDHNFVVENYGTGDQQIDLLVNTIGSYEGNLPLDFLEGESTARLQVKASGPWEFKILPLNTARTFDTPTTVLGVGDDVVLLRGANASTIAADATNASHNFVVFAYSGSAGRELVFNEIAPYSGTAILQADTFLFVVRATGTWSLAITTR